MQDATALDANGIQNFLQQTPYGSASFLSEYASNGVPAAQAIASAAQRYTIDPIVLLVHAEMEQGLIASTTYPSPPSRVEYAFDCGCEGSGSCDPTYAGFDVQVACLASALRDNLDAVAASGTTAGGWGPNDTSHDARRRGGDAGRRLHGGALSVHAPRRGRAGGRQLALLEPLAGLRSALGYTPPDGGTSASSWIGDACTGSGTCAYDGTAGTCATQFPGGLCTLACQGSCPSSSSQAQTFCADFGSEGGFCLAVCNPADPQCRTGYTCESVKEIGDTATSQYVCFPK